MLLSLNLSLVLFLITVTLTHGAQSSEDSSQKHLNMFGTKTRYIDSLSKEIRAMLEVMNNRKGREKYQILSDQAKESVDKTNKSNSILLRDFCKPIQIHFLGRHGIRNPGQSDIRTIGKLLEKLSQTSVDRSILNGLQESMLPFTLDTEKELTETGWQELEQIGHRIGIRFSEIFDGAKEDDFTFQATSKSRTVDSCKAFQSSLKNLQYDVSEKIIERNDLLRFFDICERYLSEVENRDEALVEYHSFRNSEFSAIAKNIVKRLGISHKELQLSPKEVKAVYVLAASELAAAKTNKWSKLLEREDMVILEYAADLKNYWKKGYGHAIAYQQSCGLLADTFKHLQSAVDEERHKKGVFSFAHAETLLPLVALLGLFKDPEAPRANNFHNITQQERLFKTSNICPFASNLAIVLYSCDTSRFHNLLGKVVQDETGNEIQLPMKLRKHMVRLMFKEETIRFPFCKYQLCSYQQMLKYYQGTLAQCDLEAMCKVTPKSNDEL